jgi:hypothetical protein
MARSQTTEPPVQVVPVLTDATRVESWSYFEPLAGDPDYTLFGNRVTLGMATATRHFEGYGAFQYAQLLNLPRFAFELRPFGTPIGPGAYYYDAARAPNAYQLYFKALSFRVRRLPHGLSFEVGRMSFESGAEAAGPSAELASLGRERLHGRLLGEVGWSAFERTFDGVRVDVARKRWHATAALLFPSQGAFEESANATMSGVRVATGSITFWNSSAPRPDVGPLGRLAQRPRLHNRDDAEPSALTWEAQGFVQQYRDVRGGKVRPDNTLFGEAPVDIDVTTYGGSIIGLVPLRRGRIDAVLWFAGQAGDWYQQRHRARSVVAEGGYRFTAAPWRPWGRAGITYASGDSLGRDLSHETFFPVLPSSRPFLLEGTFPQMNLQDVFGEVRLSPRTWIGARGSIHRLSLPSASDRWYSGTGATAIRGTFFGFGGRPVLGTGLGTLVETSVDVEIRKRWTLRGSLGIVKAGSAVSSFFRGDRLTVIAFENLLTF